jgi:hypothetical protein
VEQIRALVVACGGEPLDEDIVSMSVEDDNGSDGNLPKR